MVDIHLVRVPEVTVPSHFHMPRSSRIELKMAWLLGTHALHSIRCVDDAENHFDNNVVEERMQLIRWTQY